MLITVKDEVFFLENQERKLQVVNKFKKLVEKETSILNQLVDKWNELLTDTTIPEESSFEITLSFSVCRSNLKV